MNKHESMPVRFKVNDREGVGDASLGTLESGYKSNTVLNDRLIFSINLKKGTTEAETKALCDHLNKYVDNISITWF